jgi:hypothetical protein
MEDILLNLEQAFLNPMDLGSEKIVVRAEDMIESGGSKIDFSKHYFEPQPGQNYLVKILPMAGYPVSDQVATRVLYRSLPDPERKGKSFHYVASGERNDPVLTLFFDLYRQNEAGNPTAQMKIDKYLRRSSQACAKVQILNSSDPTQIGNIRLFIFSNAGQNATISQLLEKKLNPTKAQLEAGFEREDIFNIFGSPVLAMECKETAFGDGMKARDYTHSDWSPKKRGAIGIIRNEDGTVKSQHEFTAADIVDGKIKPEIKPYFEAFVSEATHIDTDLYRWFSYKKVGDKRNDEELDAYLKTLDEKLKIVLPMLKTQSLNDIQAFFASSDDEDTSENKDILKSAIPDELKDINEVFNTSKGKTNSKDVDTVDSILETI